MKRRRRKVDRPVTRRIQIIAGGRVVKTLRSKLTMPAALRELGRDPVGTEGRLMSGEPLRVTRRILRGLCVLVVYEADHSPTAEGEVYCTTTDLVTTRKVIRAGLAP